MINPCASSDESPISDCSFPLPSHAARCRDHVQLGPHRRGSGTGIRARPAGPRWLTRWPFGRVPDVATLEQAQASARLAALPVISSIRPALGDLDRLSAWVAVSGFVQAEPGYAETTAVVNAFSETVIEIFGDIAGQHARTAIGAAALPLNLPVVVAAEIALHPRS